MVTPGSRRARTVPATEIIESKRVTDLRDSLRRFPMCAATLVERFWAEVAPIGTPLVEPIPGDRCHRAVTFLWRGSARTTRVLLLANRIGDRSRREESLLRHLSGTDVWYLTFRLRADHRCSYQFAVDDRPRSPSTPAAMQEELTTLAQRAVADPTAAQSIRTRWSSELRSVLALPNAPSERWVSLPEGERGHTDTVQWRGTSQIQARSVYRYRSAGQGRQPVILLCDGDMWFERLGLPGIIDALVGVGALPPVSIIAPSAVDVETRWHDLACNTTFIEEYVGTLPCFAADLGAVNRDRFILAGQSLGGLTALAAAAFHPHRVAGVIAQSPSLWWNPSATRTVRHATVGDTPWVADLFDPSDCSGLQLRIAVGLHEGTMTDLAATLVENLSDLGAAPILTEFNGGHDFACWRVNLIEDLIAMLQPLG